VPYSNQYAVARPCGFTVPFTVDPHGRATTYWFEYGTTQLYGTTTTAQGAGSGGADVAVSAGLSGLAPGTEYHYRLVSQSDGGTVQGDDLTFDTAAALAPGATTDPATAVGTTSATLHATVDPNLDPTTYRFEYGTSSGVYDQQTSATSAGAGDSGASVSANVSGLASGTSYFFRVVATNASGTTSGGEQAFTTATPPPTPEPPATTTGAASDVTDSSATLGGTVDPKGQSTTFRFDYGTAPGVYTDHVDGAGPVTGPSAQAVTAPVSGLDASTTYYFRLSATNATGTTPGNEQSFTTDAVPPPPPPGPSATTLAAADVGQTGATLRGTVADATEYRFEYGVGNSLDSATAFVPVGSSSVGAILSGLSPGTAYSFRVVAKNSGGATAAGDTLQFTTASPPPPDDNPGKGTGTPPAEPSIPGTPAAPAAPGPAGSAPGRLSFTVSLGSLRPRGAARNPLALRVRCDAPCSLLARLYLERREARRLGLGRPRQAVLVASARGARLQAGTVRLRMRLSRRAAAAVGQAASVAFTLRIRGTSVGGTPARTLSYRVKLRRRGRSPVVTPLAAVPAP